MAPIASWGAQDSQLSHAGLGGGTCCCLLVGGLHARGWRAPSPAQTVTRGTAGTSLIITPPHPSLFPGEEEAKCSHLTRASQTAAGLKKGEMMNSA